VDGEINSNNTPSSHPQASLPGGLLFFKKLKLKRQICFHPLIVMDDDDVISSDDGSNLLFIVGYIIVPLRSNSCSLFLSWLFSWN
jgi:hypothetical protein